MSTVIAIDPGTTESAYAILDNGSVYGFGKHDNRSIFYRLREFSEFKPGGTLLIEQVASYGMPVGEEVFTTVNWSGRFHQYGESLGLAVAYLKRPEVKMRLCHQTKGVNDSVIRQRVIDLFGGKEKCIGKKSSPGPCYGMSKDEWQALALGLAFVGIERAKQ